MMGFGFDNDFILILHGMHGDGVVSKRRPLFLIRIQKQGEMCDYNNSGSIIDPSRDTSGRGSGRRTSSRRA